MLLSAYVLDLYDVFIFYYSKMFKVNRPANLWLVSYYGEIDPFQFCL